MSLILPSASPLKPGAPLATMPNNSDKGRKPKEKRDNYRDNNRDDNNLNQQTRRDRKDTRRLDDNEKRRPSPANKRARNAGYFDCKVCGKTTHSTDGERCGWSDDNRCNHTEHPCGLGHHKGRNCPTKSHKSCFKCGTDNHWTADCTVPKPDKVKVAYFKKLQEDRDAAARRDNEQNDHNNAKKSETPLNGQPNGPHDHHLNTDNNPAPLNHANQFPTTWSDTTREIRHGTAFPCTKM
jgi:hypothetical protein